MTTFFRPATRKALTKTAQRLLTRSRKKLFASFSDIIFIVARQKAALTAAWDRCGAPGLSRAPGTLKRGRPVVIDHPPGINVTEQDRILFALAMAATFRKDKRYDLPGSYRFYLARYAMLPGSDRRQPQYIERFAKTGPPTLRQFDYWVKKENDWELVLERRMTPKVYQKTRRPLLKTSTAEVLGPCSRFPNRRDDPSCVRAFARQQIPSCWTPNVICRPRRVQPHYRWVQPVV